MFSLTLPFAYFAGVALKYQLGLRLDFFQQSSPYIAATIGAALSIPRMMP